MERVERLATPVTSDNVWLAVDRRAALQAVRLLNPLEREIVPPGNADIAAANVRV